MEKRFLASILFILGFLLLPNVAFADYQDYTKVFRVSQSQNNLNEPLFFRLSQISGFNGSDLANDCSGIIAVKTNNATVYDFNLMECTNNDALIYFRGLGTGDANDILFYFNSSTDTSFHNVTMIVWNDTGRGNKSGYNVRGGVGASAVFNEDGNISINSTAGTAVYVKKDVNVPCISNGSCGSLGGVAEIYWESADGVAGAVCGLSIYTDSSYGDVGRGFLMGVGNGNDLDAIFRSPTSQQFDENGARQQNWIWAKVQNVTPSNGTGKYWCNGCEEPSTYNLTADEGATNNMMSVGFDVGNFNSVHCRFRNAIFYPTNYEPTIPVTQSTLTIFLTESQPVVCTPMWTLNSTQNQCFNSTNYQINTTYYDINQCNLTYLYISNYTLEILQYNYTQTIFSCNNSVTRQNTFYYNDTQSCGFYTSNFTLTNCTHGCLGGICTSNPAQNVPFYNQLLLLLGFGILSLIIGGVLVGGKKLSVRDVITTIISAIVLVMVMLVAIL